MLSAIVLPHIRMYRTYRVATRTSDLFFAFIRLGVRKINLKLKIATQCVLYEIVSKTSTIRGFAVSTHCKIDSPACVYTQRRMHALSLRERPSLCVLSFFCAKSMSPSRARSSMAFPGETWEQILAEFHRAVKVNRALLRWLRRMHAEQGFE